MESRLASLPAPAPGHPNSYPPGPGVAIERLYDVGGVAEVAPAGPQPSVASGLFDEFRALASRETGVSGVWVRQITLPNPAR